MPVALSSSCRKRPARNLMNHDKAKKNKYMITHTTLLNDPNILSLPMAPQMKNGARKLTSDKMLQITAASLYWLV